MNIEKLYKEYLQDVKLMQLATSRDGKPWLCNVWYVIDENNNVYWISRETRKHSEDIEFNPSVACTFHKDFNKGLMEDQGQSVVISGKAKKLSGEDCQKPYELYLERFPHLSEFQSLNAFLNDEGHHYFYKITPEEIIWWDEVNFPENSRQVVR